ncbi:hypothetical protein N474_04145 [Pseudoalteromonas luteoviolacea CPMOR-2]|uniref:Cytoplasmic protein n=2 Tax=Pseudoalteromonas luteoviolacea TaxID=43657 RepID=A0A167BPD8_9GAMM|nr:hypothetical protein N475_07075 [Pseudoalteromonas luteoviolacea DSM 6061]KZN50573.1 hypothetical protein N474_04145 [Pseudoalteromonas luteoviolacea CPMOR-2]MBE0384968.1 hypothetical protein [Pseudoalteromonas luteoviolacea DSM 6061]
MSDLMHDYGLKGSTVKRGYVQSLPKYITLCERNYLRALKVMPEEEVGNQRQIKMGSMDFFIEIDAVAKYTTDISIRQKHGLSNHIGEFELAVRLYHDAQVAEVIQHNYHQRVKPSYRYPNPNMHHKDEKYQLNAFLADWLLACIESGRVPLNWDVNNGLV